MHTSVLPLSEGELVRKGTPDSFAAVFDRHAPALREWLRAPGRGSE